MDVNLTRCVDLLNENDEKTRDEALHVLLVICERILTSQDERHRRVRVSDPDVTEKLLLASGGIESLFEIGFVEDGEYFVLPRDASMSRLHHVQKALRNLQIFHSKLQYERDEKPMSSKMRQNKKCENFLVDCVSRFKSVLQYEDPQLQNKARRIIPVERLEIGAEKRLREMQMKIKLESTGELLSSNAEHRITVEDFRLAELLDWFKNKFFTWVDCLDCPVCKISGEYKRTEPSTEPRISRTEIHQCPKCGQEMSFPRYSDPGILLKTRKGRCGEWANVFTLFCRTLGFDARIVWDQTDHVWTEVWSIGSNRWIHADPCENAMDSPLLYERGWNKKLTYIVAFSRDEIQDVTWRYTRKQSEVMQRRRLCTENDLLALQQRLNEERQNSPGYSPARKQFVTRRRALELVEMLTAPPGVTKPGEEEDGEYGGRISGSVAWRTSRGEMQEKRESHVWKIPGTTNKFELRYFAAGDEYQAVGNCVALETKAGWENGVASTNGGIFRKVETDWKMVYLARSPGEASGTISWSFETSDPKIIITEVELRASCATFHDAKVDWRVVGFGSENVDISVEDCRDFRSALRKGTTRVNIVVEVSEGAGKEAWQHAQVFRQQLEETESCSMCVTLITESTD